MSKRNYFQGTFIKSVHTQPISEQRLLFDIAKY